MYIHRKCIDIYEIHILYTFVFHSVESDKNNITEIHLPSFKNV